MMACRVSPRAALLALVFANMSTSVLAKDDGFDYANNEQAAKVYDGFDDKAGILHAGHEINKKACVLSQAKDWCKARKDCAAFTYHGSG
jgi:hypothetical protein